MDPLDPMDAARRKTGVPWLDLVVGGSAILIAVISLAVALRQSQIMERQLAASVWPHLQYGTSNQNDDGKPVISFDLENAGVGPARVHSLHMDYAGRSIRSTPELIAVCCQDLLASGTRPNWTTSAVHDQVLTAGRTVHFAILGDLPQNAPYWQRLNLERSRVRLRVCYCSVLDQCWMLDSSSATQDSLAACPAAGPHDFVE